LSFRAESPATPKLYGEGGNLLHLLLCLSSMNHLYFGDNLKWLRDRREFPDASVDLG
jgi:hypothetical protein